MDGALHGKGPSDYSVCYGSEVKYTDMGRSMHASGWPGGRHLLIESPGQQHVTTEACKR